MLHCVKLRLIALFYRMLYYVVLCQFALHFIILCSFFLSFLSIFFIPLLTFFCFSYFTASFFYSRFLSFVHYSLLLAVVFFLSEFFYFLCLFFVIILFNFSFYLILYIFFLFQAIWPRIWEIKQDCLRQARYNIPYLILCYNCRTVRAFFISVIYYLSCSLLILFFSFLRIV